MKKFYKNIQEKIKNANNLIERQSIIFYILISLLAIIAVSITLFLYSPSGEPILFWANVGQGISFFILLILYLKDKINVRVALLLFASVALFEIIIEMIYSASNSNMFNLNLITGNMIVCMGLVIVAMMSYIRLYPIILALISSVVYLLVCFILGNEAIISLAIVNTFIILGVSFAGELSNRGVQELETTNKENQRKIEILLATLNIDKKDFEDSYKKMEGEKLTPELIKLMIKDIQEKKVEN